MPHCPACRTEYREGFELCADCGEPLAPGPLPAAPAPASATATAATPAAHAGWIRVATIPEGPADPESELAVLTGRLQEEGIGFEVEDDLDSRSRRRAGVAARDPLPWFHVSVRETDRERAVPIVAEEAAAAREAHEQAYGDVPGTDAGAGADENEEARTKKPEPTSPGSGCIVLLAAIAVPLLLAVLGRS